VDKEKSSVSMMSDSAQIKRRRRRFWNQIGSFSSSLSLDFHGAGTGIACGFAFQGGWDLLAYSSSRSDFFVQTQCNITFLVNAFGGVKCHTVLFDHGHLGRTLFHS
jgi:hypothetical protein